MYPTAALYDVLAGVVNEPPGAPGVIYVAGVPVKVDPAVAVVKGRAPVGATYVVGVAAVAYAAVVVAGTVAYVAAAAVVPV